MQPLSGRTVNGELVLQWLKDNNLSDKKLSLKMGYNGTVICKAKQKDWYFPMAQLLKLSEVTGISIEELTDKNRFTTSTGKVIYTVPEQDREVKEAYVPPTRIEKPGEDYEIGLIAPFLDECCDRTTRCKTDLRDVYKVYVWYCDQHKMLPRTIDAFKVSIKGRGVLIRQEYGRTYAEDLKPYNGIMLRSLHKEDKPMEEQKKPQDEALKALAAWVSGLYMDGVDKIDVIELMKKLREVRK